MNKLITARWSRSRTFRALLVLALLYAAVRLTVHGVTAAVMLAPSSDADGGLPTWASTGTPMLPVDLQIYVDAAERLHARAELYPVEAKIEVFQYAPAFALAFSPFLLLSAGPLVVVQSLLHVAAYVGLYMAWGRVFCRLGLTGAAEALAGSLPVWLVFSAFWSDLGYLNIYIITALVATLLIEAVLAERTGWALLWLSLILQTKPHWAFAVVVPLLLGRYRFAFRLLGLAAIAYFGIIGLTMLLVEPTYVAEQYGAYVRFLTAMPSSFPWRGPNAPYLGYNHAIRQTVFYLFGLTRAASVAATWIKLLLLIPLVLISTRHALRPIREPGHDMPGLALDLAFAWYLGVFIWLDMVWELSLGIALYAYLLGTIDRPWMKTLIRCVFLPYALIDVWQLLSVAVFGLDIVAPGLYVLTDPSIYVPMIMIVILTFYAILIWRRWTVTAVTNSAALGATAYGS
ncbi:MAG: glycosyltransferase family 87 protein [Anaerolineae bacterium]